MDYAPGRGRDLRRAVVVMVAVPKPTADAMEFFEPFSDFIERVLRKRLNYLITPPRSPAPPDPAQARSGSRASISAMPISASSRLVTHVTQDSGTVRHARHCRAIVIPRRTLVRW